MILDKKGKLFGKISIVDLLVILVIIAGVAGTYFTMSVVNSGKLNDNSQLALNSASDMVEGTVVFEIKGVRAVTRDGLKIGDEVYATEGETQLIGKITGVDSKPCIKTLVDANGEIVEAQIPEQYDVKFEVEVIGKNTETGFHTESGAQILYGKDIEIKTSIVKTTPLVADIKLN